MCDKVTYVVLVIGNLQVRAYRFFFLMFFFIAFTMNGIKATD